MAADPQKRKRLDESYAEYYGRLKKWKRDQKAQRLRTDPMHPRKRA